ncbi:unnamed protein product [Ceratitis capitata]|uniref:(Mediterranean fruit fly) hypothetical protein n=1 Tax=Ceratitis capitata TaxID=7213 RepID=A0A811UWI6_CERCA|nr:unnamed protein product [Ceratitis capitata]
MFECMYICMYVHTYVHIYKRHSCVHIDITKFLRNFVQRQHTKKATFRHCSVVATKTQKQQQKQDKVKATKKCMNVSVCLCLSVRKVKWELKYGLEMQLQV